MELKKTVWFNSMNYMGQVCTDLQIMVVYPPFYIIMFFLMENLTIAIACMDVSGISIGSWCGL